jgi:2-polyprenyl-6-methoxyphenol hydroxylase-like FAD-dependent oxidoreductase
MGMKMVSMTQDKDKPTTVIFADGSVHTADIIVGADEAYSAVRQALYDDLKGSEQVASIGCGRSAVQCCRCDWVYFSVGS